MKHRKLIQIVLALAVAGVYFVNQQRQEPDNWNSGSEQALEQAIADRQSDVQVSGSAEVLKLLPDDNKGSRHQRFLIRLDSGDVILIAHNIDLAPKIDSLRKGDRIGFNGEFEWNNKGGVIHWTHKDPRSKHVHGYLEHNGKRYW